MKIEDYAKICGIKAENYFASILNKLGIQYKYEDCWFDFLIDGKYKVEVKSCILGVKKKKEKKIGYRVGRFDFTDEDNRKKQFNENIWIAFILRHEKEFLLLGFVKARDLKEKRYIPLSQLRKFKILTLEEWVEKI